MNRFSNHAQGSRGIGILPVIAPKQRGTGILPVIAPKQRGTSILPVIAPITTPKQRGISIMPVITPKQRGILPVIARQRPVEHTPFVPWTCLLRQCLVGLSIGLMPSVDLYGMDQDDDVITSSSPFDESSLIDVLQQEHSFFELKRDGRKLVAQYDESSDAYQELVNRLRSVSGSSGSGSSSGPRGWELHFDGDKMMGKFGSGDLSFSTAEYGFAELPSNGFAVQIMENQSPFSKINIKSDRDTNELEILYTRDSAAYIFRFQQNKDGRILVQQISSQDIFSEQELDFATFANKHGERLNGPISELLRYIGVSPPIGKFSPQVRRQIISRLRPPDLDRQSEFNEIINRIAAGKFSEREAATQQLNDEYQTWKTLIHQAAIDDQLTLETRSRLRKIINTSAGATRQQEYELLQASNLENDPEYLVWILINAKENPISDSDRQCVLDQLQKVTGQTFGNDVDQWSGWIQSQRIHVAKRDFSTFESGIPVVIEGPLGHMGSTIGDLIPLELANNQLKLDRGRWSEIYKGQTPQELIADLVNQLDEKRLPKSWLQVGGIYDIETTGYPQILFENVKVAAETQSADNPGAGPVNPLSPYSRVGSNSRNRDFDTPQVMGKLMLHPDLPEQERNLMVKNGQIVNRIFTAPNNKDRQPPDEKFFRLNLMEKSDSQRRLLVFESPEGDLSFRIEIGKANALVSLTQTVSKNGQRECRITDVRGPDIFVAKAADFQQLATDHRDYIESEFVPLLKSIGLSWAQ